MPYIVTNTRRVHNKMNQNPECAREKRRRKINQAEVLKTLKSSSLFTATCFKSKII